MWPQPVAFVTLLLVAVPQLAVGQSEAEIRELVDNYNKEAVDLCNESSTAGWNVATNVGVHEFLEKQVNCFLVIH